MENHLLTLITFLWIITVKVQKTKIHHRMEIPPKMELPTRHRMVLPITIVPQIQTLPIALPKTKVLNPIVAPQVTEETQTMALLLLLFHSKEMGISTMRLWILSCFPISWMWWRPTAKAAALTSTKSATTLTPSLRYSPSCSLVPNRVALVSMKWLYSSATIRTTSQASDLSLWFPRTTGTSMLCSPLLPSSRLWTHLSLQASQKSWLLSQWCLWVSLVSWQESWTLWKQSWATEQRCSSNYCSSMVVGSLSEWGWYKWVLDQTKANRLHLRTTKIRAVIPLLLLRPTILLLQLITKLLLQIGPIAVPKIIVPAAPLLTLDCLHPRLAQPSMIS